MPLYRVLSRAPVSFRLVAFVFVDGFADADGIRIALVVARYLFFLLLQLLAPRNLE